MNARVTGWIFLILSLTVFLWQFCSTWEEKCIQYHDNAKDIKDLKCKHYQNYKQLKQEFTEEVAVELLGREGWDVIVSLTTDNLLSVCDDYLQIQTVDPLLQTLREFALPPHGIHPVKWFANVMLVALVLLCSVFYVIVYPSYIWTRNRVRKSYLCLLCRRTRVKPEVPSSNSDEQTHTLQSPETVTVSTDVSKCLNCNSQQQTQKSSIVFSLTSPSPFNRVIAE